MKDEPQRILEVRERWGNGYTTCERLSVDWGDGAPTETFRATMPDGVRFLPLLPNGNVLLVHQYRVLSHGWSHEFPAGVIDAGESEEAAVLRELEEETGYKANRLEKVLTLYLSPWMVSRKHLYIASELSEGVVKRDLAEKGMTVEEVSPTQLYEMILDGTIRDASTVSLALFAFQKGILKHGSLTEEHPF